MIRLKARECGHGLTGDWYRSPELYEAELCRIWRAGWIFAGLSCQIEQPGDYLTLACDRNPLLVMRGDDGRVQAFQNICRHRGTVLCNDEAGTVGRAIVCPYHQWTYTRQGELLSCRGMQANLDRSELGLRALAAEEAAGLIFISEAASPPDFTGARRTFSAMERHGLQRAKVAAQQDYLINANWKIVWENNRECYHCDVNHPQYIKSNFDIVEGDRATPARRAQIGQRLADSEAYWRTEDLSAGHAEGGLATFPDPNGDIWYSATRTILADGFETESMDGQRVAPLMGNCEAQNEGVLRVRSLLNFWCHASCDHAVLTRLLPAGINKTWARVYWLVDESAQEGADYHLDRLMPFWKLTSEQDWQLCERVQQGINSTAYRPGPLSEVREYNVEAFFRWYERQLAEN